jgi:hypothetical protein
VRHASKEAHALGGGTLERGVDVVEHVRKRAALYDEVQVRVDAPANCESAERARSRMRGRGQMVERQQVRLDLCVSLSTEASARGAGTGPDLHEVLVHVVNELRVTGPAARR